LIEQNVIAIPSVQQVGAITPDQRVIACSTN
jgi:hypothetical protein